MRAELDDDLSGTRRLDEPVRPLHHLVERLRRRQAGEHDLRLCADFGRRAGSDTADLLELGERAAAIAQHPVAALDQVFADRHPDLTDADEAHRFHSSHLALVPSTYASSSDWSEKFTLMPSEPSITVHSRSSKLRNPLTTKGSASAISRAAWALAARRIVRPSPRVLPSASASGPDANSTPFFSRPIMYSRWRGRCSAIFSGAAPPLESTTYSFLRSMLLVSSRMRASVIAPSPFRPQRRGLSIRENGGLGRADQDVERRRSMACIAGPPHSATISASSAVAPCP